jgi:hypothetical protein
MPRRKRSGWKGPLVIEEMRKEEIGKMIKVGSEGVQGLSERERRDRIGRRVRTKEPGR